MSTQIVSKEEITRLLNDWYQTIISQHVIKAKYLKSEIDNKNSSYRGKIRIFLSIILYLNSDINFSHVIQRDMKKV